MMLLAYKERNASLPSLGLARTQEEVDALNGLHEFIFTTNIAPEIDDLYDSQLDGLLYRLLCAMWFRKLSLVKALSCPTDIAVVIMCLNRDGSFKPASQATQRFAGLQYFTRVTAVQRLRYIVEKMEAYKCMGDGVILHKDDEVIEDDDGDFVR